MPATYGRGNYQDVAGQVFTAADGMRIELTETRVDLFDAQRNYVAGLQLKNLAGIEATKGLLGRKPRLVLTALDGSQLEVPMQNKQAVGQLWLIIDERCQRLGVL